MRYEILGPLRVTDGDRASFISAPKTEQLLAILLIRSGQVVTIDELIAELWGDHAPRRAVAGLYVYISQLRKFLLAAGCPQDPILTRPSGYLMQVGAGELDFHLFQQLVNTGRLNVKERCFQEAAGSFGRALSLCRGPLLASLANGPIGYGFHAWFSEARLESEEMFIDAELQLGHHREVIGQLYSLTSENSLREAFYHQLMLALYRCDRQADALAVYRRARQTLNEELGLEPCRALQELHSGILRADPWLELEQTVA
ncbi:MAG TPA: AfsR/SARP family transcriptional regulator [Streptosporangiaceae bacterium]|jgi:DNA-binding SARP family transcriptional activator